jgi:hypothetical protein
MEFSKETDPYIYCERVKLPVSDQSDAAYRLITFNVIHTNSFYYELYRYKKCGCRVVLICDVQMVNRSSSNLRC